MKKILIIITLISSAAFAGPTKKVLKCDQSDYTNIDKEVYAALTDSEVRTNDKSMLKYIQSVLPQEIGGFDCKKIVSIASVDEISESEVNIYELENQEFVLELVITRNNSLDFLDSVNVKLIDAK